jgi:hypothetical protein
MLEALAEMPCSSRDFQTSGRLLALDVDTVDVLLPDCLGGSVSSLFLVIVLVELLVDSLVLVTMSELAIFGLPEQQCTVPPGLSVKL